MIPTARQLYESILHRAAEEWGIEGYEDVDRDIGQAFDPLVRFMAGATASELERVYHHINDAESRVMERIIRVLVPEHFHLPRPAHALAVADPAGESWLADETLSLSFQLEDSHTDIPFTPVFPLRLLPVTIRVVATESEVLELSARPRRRKAQEPAETEFRKLLIGFEAPRPITDWSQVCLWFDLAGSEANDAERAALFKAMRQVQVSLQGHALRVAPGLPEKPLLIEDHLSGAARMVSELRAGYDRHFLTFLDSEVPPPEAVLPALFIASWFARGGPSKTQLNRALPELMEDKATPLYWMVLDFPQAMHIREIGQRLRLRFNVFPVVNRRLCGAGKGEHHFLQNNALKWIHLTPQEPFQAIRRVYQEKPPENPHFQYKPFADFREDTSPSYTLRYGGIGRWDDFNVWRRLAYVISLLQENYAHQDLIQKAADSLSLEDVHHLLGRRIDTVKDDGAPTRDIYLLLHPGAQSGLRVRVEYWTSAGKAANRVPARSKLSCSTAAAAVLDTDSLELLSTSAGGEDPLDTTARLQALRHTLLSRGRLVTREDLRSYCQAFLQDRIRGLQVREGVGSDLSGPSGLTRRLEIWLEPAPEFLADDWEAVCHQLMQLIAERTTSVVPVWVGVQAIKSAGTS